MKNHISSLLRLAIVTLAAFPAFALAAPPTTSPYNTDVTNSYVQDQTSQVMQELNNILCFMGAMAPDQMVNLATNSGNYIALVDQNTCKSSGGGGKSTSTGPAYVPAIVHSARASSTADMLVKVWLTPEPGNDITVYATATTAPSATLPYGVFRMDYCGGGANCPVDKGFINATSSGVAFYSNSTMGGSGHTTALQLNATSTTAGSGAVNDVNPWSGNSNFTFAYNSLYFVRNDGTTSQCFDRSALNANESVWRYGLYDATTGAQITRNSGFPIEYTDTSVTPNVTANGYIGYHGLWAQGTGPASGSTVQQVTYGASGATKTPYTLLKTGGKLHKYTTVQKTLADLHKVTFWYFVSPNTNIPATGTAVMTGGAQGTQYEIYWDDTTKQFMVSGKEGATHNMEPLPAGPTAIAATANASNAAMVAANSWGLFGWSQMMGGQFGIKGSDFANLTGATPSTIQVRAQMEDVVYPSQFAALGNLTCINDCPTRALIDASNVPGATSSPFTVTTAGWTPIASTAFTTYTLNPATGNLIDPASGVVVSTATTGTNANGIRSGRLLATADLTADFNAMITAKNTANVCGGTPCTQFNQGDVDFLPIGKSYYEWETGGQAWNQLAILKNATTGAPVTFDPPLAVNFVVPTGAKYNNYAGATLRLEYGGFGELWGIPNECVDAATNTACTFGTGGTSQQNQRWTSLFSIPFDATLGVVTATVAGVATTYLVKPLDKEIRLAHASLPTCTAAGLTAPAAGTITLPAATSFIDPTTSAGTKPTFATAPAPQVIHGVKQY